jgi:hypothetical protein
MRPAAELSLWGAALLAGVAAFRWSTAVPFYAPVERVIPPAPGAPKTKGPDTLIASARGIVAANPFRLERRPTAIPYGSETEPDGRYESVPPKPDLLLTGVLGGPPWQAVLTGVPGHDGSVVVREGESIDVFVVSRVTRDTVVVQGADTTYVLTVRTPWR